MPKSQKTARERVIFTLPPDLARDVQEYASIVRQGNKSGFVADALRSYIQRLHATRHTQKLRASYADTAPLSQAINHEWEQLDADAWTKLDHLESTPPE